MIYWPYSYVSWSVIGNIDTAPSHRSIIVIISWHICEVHSNVKRD
jgi:hypothetical protein